MLRLLSITNFATIDHLEVELVRGLNVLTGETGAGKSIIVDALSLLLGGRADATEVRAGYEKALIQGVFSSPESLPEGVIQGLSEAGIDDEDELILSREVGAEGRSTARINGRIVTARALREVGEHLVDIHGQSEHLSLLRVREHLDMLDRYGETWGLRRSVADSVRALRETRRKMSELQGSEGDRARSIDMLRYQIQEIEAANLEAGEEEALERELNLLDNAERLIQLSESAYQHIYGDDTRSHSVVDVLGQASRELEELVRLDSRVQETRDTAASLSAQLEDLAHAIRGYRDQLEFDPDRLEQVHDRLSLIGRLKRKYGDSIEEVLAFADSARAQLQDLETADERVEELIKEERQMLTHAGDLAARLSKERASAAGALPRALYEELDELSMTGTRFEVQIQREPSEAGLPVSYGQLGTEGDSGPSEGSFAFDQTGIDRVEFLMSANQGEPPRPLARIASGGESARIMLAIKVVLSSADEIPILVFDEIDAGIGGRVGDVVGKKLWRLSRGHQVLCVTHLPQIAAFADHHIRAEKAVADGRTRTEALPLEGEDRLQEMTLMLGGVGAARRQNAKEMIEAAEAWKGRSGASVT